jgi:hypothetical protein
MRASILVTGLMLAAGWALVSCESEVKTADRRTAEIVIASPNLAALTAAAIRVMGEEGLRVMPEYPEAAGLTFVGDDSRQLDRVLAAERNRSAATEADSTVPLGIGGMNMNSNRGVTRGGFHRSDGEEVGFDPRQNSIVHLRFYPAANQTRVVGTVRARFDPALISAAGASDPAMRLLGILESDRQLQGQLAQIKKAVEK